VRGIVIRLTDSGSGTIRAASGAEIDFHPADVSPEAAPIIEVGLPVEFTPQGVSTGPRARDVRPAGA
jgi:hypothetical protein